MIVRWQHKDVLYRNNYFVNEYKKNILKSLLSWYVNNDTIMHIYCGVLFAKFSKYSSISFYSKFCIFTGNTRSVCRRFKLVRHQCKKLASNGYLVGVRKSSF